MFVSDKQYKEIKAFFEKKEYISSLMNKAVDGLRLTRVEILELSNARDNITEMIDIIPLSHNTRSILKQMKDNLNDILSNMEWSDDTQNRQVLNLSKSVVEKTKETGSKVSKLNNNKGALQVYLFRRLPKLFLLVFMMLMVTHTASNIINNIDNKIETNINKTSHLYNEEMYSIKEEEEVDEVKHILWFIIIMLLYIAAIITVITFFIDMLYIMIPGSRIMFTTSKGDKLKNGKTPGLVSADIEETPRLVSTDAVYALYSTFKICNRKR